MENAHTQPLYNQAYHVQGSVLGPSLFLFYVDDIADSLNAKVRLFANDTIAYLAIVTDEDARSQQNDLTKLGE